MAKVHLKHPFQYGENQPQVTELEIPRITAKHMRNVGDIKSIDGQLKLLQNLLAQPSSFIDKIDFEDIAAIFEVMESFLAPSDKQTQSN